MTRVIAWNLAVVEVVVGRPAWQRPGRGPLDMSPTVHFLSEGE